MSRLLSLQYYFTIRPDPNFKYTTITIVIAILLILAGIGLHIYRRKFAKDAIVKKMIKKHPATLKWFGIVLLILLYFRESGIPYLSMRIWWFVWLGFLLYKIIKEGVKFKKNYAIRLLMAKEKSKKTRYIPKPKRKK